MREAQRRFGVVRVGNESLADGIRWQQRSIVLREREIPFIDRNTVNRNLYGGYS